MNGNTSRLRRLAVVASGVVTALVVVFAVPAAFAVVEDSDAETVELAEGNDDTTTTAVDEDDTTTTSSTVVDDSTTTTVPDGSTTTTEAPVTTVPTTAVPITTTTEAPTTSTTAMPTPTTAAPTTTTRAPRPTTTRAPRPTTTTTRAPRPATTTTTRAPRPATTLPPVPAPIEATGDDAPVATPRSPRSGLIDCDDCVFSSSSGSPSFRGSPASNAPSGPRPVADTARNPIVNPVLDQGSAKSSAPVVVGSENAVTMTTTTAPPVAELAIGAQPGTNAENNAASGEDATLASVGNSTWMAGALGAIALVVGAAIFGLVQRRRTDVDPLDSLDRPMTPAEDLLPPPPIADWPTMTPKKDGA